MKTLLAMFVLTVLTTGVFEQTAILEAESNWKSKLEALNKEYFEKLGQLQAKEIENLESLTKSMRSQMPVNVASLSLCMSFFGAAAGLTLFATRIAAFDSYGVTGVTGGAIHGEITEDATKRLGIDDCDELQQAVRRPDWEQTSITRLQLLPNNLYTPSNHFDRAAGKSHEQAFKEAAHFVRTEHQKCIQFARNNDFDASVASLGRVLHAVQDLVSHSNLIDLTDAQRKEVLAAIWDEAKVVPSELKLTGYDATARDPGKPPGDKYGHDDFSKDNPKKNAEAKTVVQGKSKYEIAYSLAIDVSESVLLDTKSRLSDNWSKLARKFD